MLLSQDIFFQVSECFIFHHPLLFEKLRKNHRQTITYKSTKETPTTGWPSTVHPWSTSVSSSEEREVSPKGRGFPLFWNRFNDFDEKSSSSKRFRILTKNNTMLFLVVVCFDWCNFFADRVPNPQNRLVDGNRKIDRLKMYFVLKMGNVFLLCKFPSGELFGKLASSWKSRSNDWFLDDVPVKSLGHTICYYHCHSFIQVPSPNQKTASNSKKKQWNYNKKKDTLWEGCLSSFS